MGNFHSLEILGRGSETQFQVSGILNYLIQCFNGYPPFHRVRIPIKVIKSYLLTNGGVISCENIHLIGSFVNCHFIG